MIVTGPIHRGVVHVAVFIEQADESERSELQPGLAFGFGIVARHRCRHNPSDRRTAAR